MEIISCKSLRSSRIIAATFLSRTCNTIKMVNSRSSVTQLRLVAKINSQTSVVRHLLQQVYLTCPTINIIAISRANQALWPLSKMISGTRPRLVLIIQMIQIIRAVNKKEICANRKIYRNYRKVVLRKRRVLILTFPELQIVFQQSMNKS